MGATILSKKLEVTISPTSRNRPSSSSRRLRKSHIYLIITSRRCGVPLSHKNILGSLPCNSGTIHLPLSGIREKPTGREKPSGYLF
ncbi:hypothetical protein BC938DRAFT_480505 [Jimgerdemannia flammicorona]|uniref:Uncharacterized protein n=1 Tax=Jimgerdemannia flammicorona TaxID=994334 RepID=A0A433QIK5_9FUNG|nr:hypothetical protein BC938DRAFT_480505 [Jimgerdemannia flammicorona]